MSAVARSRGIDNTPPPQAVAALHDLIGHLLDPLREAWGGPVVVNSGYRSPALNAAVGGAPRSRHMYGEAADITVGSPSANAALFVAMFEVEVFVAPLFVTGINVFTKWLAQVTGGAVPVNGVFFKSIERG